jgi:phenol hydroxylase P3 protein
MIKMNSQAKVNNKKLNAKERYRILTRDLDWDFSYADRKDAFPYEEFEGIKITDWSKWEDPFRLTMDSIGNIKQKKKNCMPFLMLLLKTMVK